MDMVINISLLGLLTGVLGTLGGAILLLLIRRVGEAFLGVVLGASAGIMTVIVFIDLIPESLNVGSIWTMLTGLVLGIILIMILDFSFPHKHFSTTENLRGRYIKAGILLAIGIALHNLPEGLAIGAGFISNEKLGLSIAIIIALHNMPEGLAVATTLSLGKMKTTQIFLLTALAGLPMGLGAFLGAYFGQLSPMTLSIALGLAAGAMIYITFDELVPDAHNLTDSHWATLGIVGGMIIGVLVCNLL